MQAPSLKRLVLSITEIFPLLFIPKRSIGPAWVPDAVLRGFGFEFRLRLKGFRVCPSTALIRVSSFK